MSVYHVIPDAQAQESEFWELELQMIMCVQGTKPGPPARAAMLLGTEPSLQAQPLYLSSKFVLLLSMVAVHHSARAEVRGNIYKDGFLPLLCRSGSDAQVLRHV